ncbi:hypothetical protein BDW02DRAFT_500762 [Decorospora gaudefroyi]|uniref:Uncharacterized protein n=1 Tax=Decorospora gaudefroyi TaxID=184978 RepID=A0A6A5KAR8_9PLEO|nr:hypothetical protein BDW02DRAFT_500762 [Decorospora gaudefroyi]
MNTVNKTVNNTVNNTDINRNKNINMDNTDAPKMGHKRKHSARLVTGIQKVFNNHHRSESASPGSTPIIVPMSASPAPAALSHTLKKLYRFQSPKQKAQPASSPPSTADATMVESDSTVLSSPLPSSPPSSNTLTPPSTPDYAVSASNKQEVAAAPLLSPKKVVDQVPQPALQTRLDDIPMAPVEKRADASASLPKTSQPSAVEAKPTKSDAYTDELEAAMAGMRAAEKLLNQRHAAMKPTVTKAKANTSKKVKPRNIAVGNSEATARLPAKLSPHRRTQSSTPNEACEALRRRQAVKDLAFYAADGCPTNIDTIEQISAHFYLKARHTDSEMPDVTFNVNGVSVRASQMPYGSVERNWITRYNAVVDNAQLVERRLMNAEDHEMIVTQLFPDERGHILKPEHFEIFMTGLGEEGILTKGQAKTTARVAVTTEEFDKGARYTGPSVNRLAHRRNPTAVAMFDIPKEARRHIASFSPRPTQSQGQNELYYYLRILVEAAVYGQNFWKGYFFPSARNKLNDFYQAHKLSQEGWLLPPNLTDYKRDWTHREIRLLQRGQLICDLLQKYEANELTDYGIIRAIRATFVGIPAQPFWCTEDLESFLYHRIAGSGLSVSRIVDILVLHPDHDATFANQRVKAQIVAGLRDRAETFKQEEEARMQEIGRSQVTFKRAKKREMRRWERVKAGWKRAFGKKEVLLPFDPFAPEHGVVGEGGGCIHSV